MRVIKGDHIHKFVTPDADVAKLLRGDEVDFSLVDSPLQQVPDGETVLHDRDFVDNCDIDSFRLIRSHRDRVNNLMRNAGMDVMNLPGLYRNDPYTSLESRDSRWVAIERDGDFAAKVKRVGSEMYSDRREVKGPNLVHELILPLNQLVVDVMRRLGNSDEAVTIAPNLSNSMVLTDVIHNLSTDEMIDVFIQTAFGLRHMHSNLDLVHCDVKPENIMIQRGDKITATLFDAEFSFPASEGQRLLYGCTKEYFCMNYLKPRSGLGGLSREELTKVFDISYLDHFALAMSMVHTFFGFDELSRLMQDGKIMAGPFAARVVSQLDMWTLHENKLKKILRIISDLIASPSCSYSLDDVMEDLEAAREL